MQEEPAKSYKPLKIFFKGVEEDVTVNLITIYDKADVANISDKELKDLITAFHHQR